MVLFFYGKMLKNVEKNRTLWYKIYREKDRKFKPKNGGKTC